MRYLNFLILPCLLVSTSATQADTAWTLKRQQADIKVYQKPTSTIYPITRGQLIIPASMSAIATVLEDLSSCSLWVYTCRKGRLVKQHSQTQRLDYIVFDSPLWLPDRDIYISSQSSFNPATKTFTAKLTGKENYDRGQIGRVRIKGMHGLWELKATSSDTTQVLYQIHADLQLKVHNYPKSLVSFHLNAYMVESVFQTMNNLKRVAMKTSPRPDLVKRFQ